MTIRPLASAGLHSARTGKKPEELTRDLVESGVELTVPRWIRLFGRRRATPEEAAGVPEELCARVPGKARVPVRSREDLTELAVFHGLVPSSVLPQPALAEALRALDQSQWHFQDPDGNEVGTFGAYQALTEPDQPAVRADWNGHRIDLDSAGTEELARFYDPKKPHPLARLEQQGYDLFDANGERCAAPQATGVGKGALWLAANRLDELGRFEALHPEQGDLALTRAAHDLPVGDAEAVRKLLAGVKPEEHRRLLPAALHAVEGLPGKTQVALADALPEDAEARRGWASHLAGDPEVGTAARLTANLLEKKEDVWRSFADQPDQDAIGFLRDALQTRPRPAVAAEALAELKRRPASAAAARAMEIWKGGPEQVSRLLANPDLSGPEIDALGQSLYGQDPRLLLSRAERPLPSARLAAEIWHRLRTETARKLVFEAGMGDKTGADLYLPLLDGLKNGSSWDEADRLEDAEQIAAAARAALKEHPVVAAMDRWQIRDAEAVVRAALDSKCNTPDALLARALQLCSDHDYGLQERLLQEQARGGGSAARAARVALELRPTLKSHPARVRLFQLATREPERANQPVELGRELLSSTVITDEYDYYRDEKQQDAAVLAARLRPLLAQSPVLQALDRWGQGEEVWRVREALSQEAVRTPEEVHRYGVRLCGAGNPGLRDKLLADQKASGRQPEAQAAEVAIKLLPALASRAAQVELWHLSQREPATVMDERALFARLLATTSVTDEYDYYRAEKLKDAQALAARLRPLLAQSPVLQALDRWGQGDEVWRIREAVAQEAVQTPEQVHRYGVRICGDSNQGLREKLLGEQKVSGRQPEAQAAAVALKLLPELKSRPVQLQLWHLSQDEPGTVVDERALCARLLAATVIQDEYDYYRAEKLQDAEALAARLRPMLAQSTVLQALDRWGQGEEVWRIREAVAQETVQTPEEVHRYGARICGDGNPGLREKLLVEQKTSGRQPEAQAAEVALKLIPELKSRPAQLELWHLSQRDPASVVDERALCARLLAATVVTDDYDYYRAEKLKDAEALAARLRPMLAQSPVLQSLDRWGQGDEVWRIREALAMEQVRTPEQVHGYGVALASLTPELRPVLLAEQKACGRQPEAGAAAAAEDLMPQLASRAARNELWSLATREPATVVRPPDLYARLLDTAEVNPDYDWEKDTKTRDGRLLAELGLKALGQDPAAVQLARWQPDDPIKTFRVARAGGSKAELAVALCGVRDTELQDRILADEKTPLAELTRKLRGELQSANGRYALWRAALEQPELKSADDVRAFGRTALGHFDQSRPFGQAAQDRARLESMLDTYVQVMSLVAPAAPSALREEEKRVVVGGVVVKKAGQA